MVYSVISFVSPSSSAWVSSRKSEYDALSYAHTPTLTSWGDGQRRRTTIRTQPTSSPSMTYTLLGGRRSVCPCLETKVSMMDSVMLNLVTSYGRVWRRTH